MSIRTTLSNFGKWLAETTNVVIVVGAIGLMISATYSIARSEAMEEMQANSPPSEPSVDIDIVDGLVLLRDGPRLITIQTQSTSGSLPSEFSPESRTVKELVASSSDASRAKTAESSNK